MTPCSPLFFTNFDSFWGEFGPNLVIFSQLWYTRGLFEARRPFAWGSKRKVEKRAMDSKLCRNCFAALPEGPGQYPLSVLRVGQQQVPAQGRPAL